VIPLLFEISGVKQLTATIMIKGSKYQASSEFISSEIKKRRSLNHSKTSNKEFVVKDGVYAM